MHNQKGSMTIGVLVILVVLIGLGAYFLLNNKTTEPISNYKTVDVSAKPAPQASQTPNSDDLQSQLVRKCGDIPEELSLKINQQHFDIVKGPLWSEDCKYIVWSKWISGTGGPGIASQSANSHLNEGVFTYIPAIKEYKTIYQPKQNNETPELVNIKNDVVEYKVSTSPYFLILKQILK